MLSRGTKYVWTFLCFLLQVGGMQSTTEYRYLQSASNIFRVGEFLRHMMMFDMRGFGKGTPAVFR